MMELREIQNKQASADSAAQVWILRPLRDQPGLSPQVLPEGELVIGSAASCDYPLPINGVSATHCRLIRGGDRLQAFSEDPRTWLNDGPFHKASLKSGDRLTIGPVTFRVERSARAHTPMVEISEESRVTGDALSDSHLLRYLRRAIERDPSVESLAELDAHHSSRDDQPLEQVFEELRGSLQRTQQQSHIQQAQLRELEQRHPDKMPAETHAESSAEIPLSGNTPLSSSAVPIETSARLKELEQQLAAYQSREQHRAQLRERWRKIRALRRTEQQQAKASEIAIRTEQDRQREEWQQREISLKQQLANQQQESRTQRQHLETREQALQQETARLTQRFEQLEQSLTLAQEQETETLALLSTLQQKLAEETSRATDWERERSDFSQEQDRLQQEQSQLQEQMLSLKQSLHATEQQLNSTQQQLHTAEQQLTSARQQQAEQSESLETYQSLLAEKEADLQSLVAEQETLKLQLAEKAAELAAAQRDFHEADLAREELHTRLQQLAEEQQDQQRLWDAEREQTQATLEAVQADLEQTRQALQRSEQEQREAAEQATHDQDAAWEKISEERDRLYQLRQELQQEHTAFTQARQDLDEVRAEVEQQRQELRQRQQEFHEKQEHWYQLQNEQENEATAELNPSPLVSEPKQETDFQAQSPQPPVGAEVEPEVDSARTDIEEDSDTDSVQHDTHFAGESAPSDSELADAISEFFSSPEDDDGVTSAANQLHEDDALRPTDFEESVELSTPETTELDALDSDTIATWTAQDPDPQDTTGTMDSTDSLDATDSAASPEASLQAEAEVEAERKSVELTTDSDPSEHAEEPQAGAETDEELDKLRRELAEMFGLGHSPQESEQTADDLDFSDLASTTDDSEQANDTTDQDVETGDDQLPLVFEDGQDEDGDSGNSCTTTGTPQHSLLTQFEETLATIDSTDDSVELSEPSTGSGETTTALDKSQQNQQLPSQSTTAGETAEVVVEDIEDADSVAAYMERLFARTNCRQNYSAPAQANSPAKAAAEVSSSRSIMPQVSEIAPQISLDSNSAATTAPAQRQAKPKPVIDREVMKQEIASLRDVANQTARCALAAHAWKQVKTKIWASGMMTAVTTVAAGVLISSPRWSPVSYENYGWLTLLLATISGMELFRARLELIRLREAGRTSSTLFANTTTSAQSAPTELPAASPVVAPLLEDTDR